MQVGYQVYKHKRRKTSFNMFTKGKLSSQKNPQTYKNPNNIIPCKVWYFLLDIVDIA